MGFFRSVTVFRTEANNLKHQSGRHDNCGAVSRAGFNPVLVVRLLHSFSSICAVSLWIPCNIIGLAEFRSPRFQILLKPEGCRPAPQCHETVF